MLSNELNTAIDRLDPTEVQQLLAQGANPYFPGDDGRTPVQTWLDSQKLGNPYAEKMGQDLFAIAPISREEDAELARIGQQQVANLAQALGVLEHARQAGIDYHHAYIPPQPLEGAQACWAIVYQALDRNQGRAPEVSVQDFAQQFAKGVATGRALLHRDPLGHKVTLAASQGPIVPLDQDRALIEQTLRNALGQDPMTVSPRGEVRPQASVREGGYASLNGHLISSHRHAAAIFHVNMDEQGQPQERLPSSYWNEQSGEDRLNQALKNKDWERAQALVSEGAQIQHLPINSLPYRLQEMVTRQDMDQMYALGFNPLEPLALDGSDRKQLAIHQAQSQEQFDSLLREMKRLDPNLPVFRPESMQGHAFWTQSRYFVDDRSQGAILGQWVGEKLRETFTSITQWRTDRAPTSAEDPAPATPEKPGHKPK